MPWDKDEMEALLHIEDGPNNENWTQTGLEDDVKEDRGVIVDQHLSDPRVVCEKYAQGKRSPGEV